VPVPGSDGGSSQPLADGGSAIPFPSQRHLFGGDRPATLWSSDGYQRTTPTPLVVVLHGYGGDGVNQTAYLGFGALVSERGVLLVAPNGMTDSQGHRFWNATEACCDFDQSRVDDSTYLAELIADISTEWNVDPRRVFLMGHSNGGFMAYRMACDHPELIAGIVSLAGESPGDRMNCRENPRLSVLQIQGTADHTIPYDGGALGGVAYPGAVATAALWGAAVGCSGTLVSAGANVDVDSSLADAETTVAQFESCPTGIEVGLWSITGGAHVPALASGFGDLVWNWMAAHPKP
jgi:polyhydroxybutyrate depolymerase